MHFRIRLKSPRPVKLSQREFDDRARQARNRLCGEPPQELRGLSRKPASLRHVLAVTS